MTTSYNNWPASKDPNAIGVKPFSAAGHAFPAGVKGGDVAVVLKYVAEQFHRRVEKLGSGCWGYNYRPNRNNPSTLSCHSSGTALDLNAPRHPNGQFPTFTQRQVTAMRQILAEVDHVVAWGFDFSGTKDPMHVEIHGTPAEVKKVANKLRAHTTVKPAPALADPRLHEGCTGQRVKDIQNALTKHGFPVKADGGFGHGTDIALRAFQKAKRLNPDGITWAATWAALRKP